MNTIPCNVVVVYFWIAAIALTSTASQAMQPGNDANVIRDELVAAISATPVAGLNDAQAQDQLRDEVMEVPNQLASNKKTRLTIPYNPSSLECVEGCPLNVLPNGDDLFASLVDGPIPFGPTMSGVCVVVLEVPSRKPTRVTTRNLIGAASGRHWWLCLVGVPENHLKMLVEGAPHRIINRS